MDNNIIKIIEDNSTPTESTYTKFDYDKVLNSIWETLSYEKLKFMDELKLQKEILGYIDYINEKIDKRYVLVSDINTKYSPVINTYCLNNGATCKCKISKKVWNNQPIQENQIIYIHSMEHKFAQKKVGETKDKKGKIKPVFETDESKMDWWILRYSIIDNIDEVLE